MMSDPSVEPLMVKLADEFGDYGLISVVVLKHAGSDIVIDEHLMSCRVLQHSVESLTMKILGLSQIRRKSRIGAAD
jgi:predicted enzyme involved in methoxymalonyl-ACP biosynthesis